MCNWPNNLKCPMVAAILNILTSEESVESQIDHLLSDVCPQVAMMTQEECVERMPDFWRSAGVQLWNYYFGSAFCQELAECPSKGQRGSMTCDFCVLNLIDTIDTLTDDIYMITDYMAGEAFCYSGEFPGEEEECEATIRGLLPLSLSSIPGACRRGFVDLCNQVFQACED